MKTKLIIELNTEDCKKIMENLKSHIEGISNLNPETYLLYNKIKYFDVAYSDIEGK